MAAAKRAVVALGGNAISLPGQEDTIANQFANTRRSLDGIIDLARDGFQLVVSHGNGPQVGNALLRVEETRGKAPVLPLGVLVADTEGGMGYMIEQSLMNRLREERLDRSVATVITQMLVDRNDPAIADPSKFVGQWYSADDAKLYSETRGWQMKEDGKRGWRRVVPSPIPVRAIAADTIRTLVERDTIVIAAGGGGVPVFETEDGKLEGLDAVIDKDHASAVIGQEIGATVLCILTSVESVCLNFGEPNEQQLGTVTVNEMKAYLDAGHFPKGSMGPKVRAAISFIEQGGEMVVVTSFTMARDAIKGAGGTRIVPD